jgi:hypothetical protein
MPVIARFEVEKSPQQQRVSIVAGKGYCSHSIRSESAMLSMGSSGCCGHVGRHNRSVSRQRADAMLRAVCGF